MKKKRSAPQAFGLILALSAGCMLTLLLRPSPAPRDEFRHPFRERIDDLTLRFHTRPVLRGRSLSGNAAQFYRRAAANLLLGAGQEVLADLERGQRPSAPDLDVWIHVNMNAVDMVRRGTLQFGSALLIEPLDGYEADAPEVGAAPVLAGLMIEAGLRKREKGEVLEGARMLLDAARFAQDLARGGGIVHRKYAAWAELMSLRWFIRMLRDAPFTAAEMRTLLVELDRLAAGVHPLSHTLDTEGALLLADLGRREGETAPGRSWTVPSPAAAASLADAAVALVGTAHAFLDAGGWVDPQEWGEFLARTSASAPVPLRDVLQDFDVLVSVERRVEVLRRVARIGAALAAFRKVKGGFPGTLAELTPGLLAVVPRDPFCGGPFLYRTTGGPSSTLTSVGPDGDPDPGLGGSVDLSGTSRGEAVPDGDWIFRFGTGR